MIVVYLRRKTLWRRVWDKLSGRDRRVRRMIDRLHEAVEMDRKEMKRWQKN